MCSATSLEQVTWCCSRPQGNARKVRRFTLSVCLTPALYMQHNLPFDFAAVACCRCQRLHTKTRLRFRHGRQACQPTMKDFVPCTSVFHAEAIHLPISSSKSASRVMQTSTRSCTAHLTNLRVLSVEAAPPKMLTGRRSKTQRAILDARSAHLLFHVLRDGYMTWAVKFLVEQ